MFISKYNKWICKNLKYILKLKFNSLISNVSQISIILNIQKLILKSKD